MKKILLSCACCVLALGLVTGCEDEVEDVTPEDPNAGVVTPGDDDGGSTEPGGSGDEEDFLPVLGTVTAGDYFLGIEVDSVPYYFDGTIYSDYYGNVTEHGYEAVTITVTEVTGGYTLSFADSDEATQYIAMSESGTHRNFVWSEETPYVWSYDTTFETFVALDSEGVYYYMGTYGTFKEMAMNEYSYLEEGASTYAQYPAHLYEVITYNAPTAITVTGEDTVEVGQRITLTATVSGEGNVDPRYVWSWTSDNNGEVTISNTGVVLGVAEGSVTITATSIKDASVSGSITITVTEASGDAPATYKLGALDEANFTYRWLNGEGGTVSGSSYTHAATSTIWDEGLDIYIEAIEDDGITNSCTLSFYNDNGDLMYITHASSTYLTFADEPYTWIWDSTNEYFYDTEQSARYIRFYTGGDNTFRAYTSSDTYNAYPAVKPYLVEPEAPEMPEVPNLEMVTSLESGESYYLGSVDDDATHLVDGGLDTNSHLTTTMNFDSAALVTVTSTGTNGETTWTMTIDGKTAYAYVSGSYINFELVDSGSTSAQSGSNSSFTWNSTLNTLVTPLYTNSYYGTSSYLEFYSNYVTCYAFKEEKAGTITNAAHFYQVVDS